MMLRTYAAAGGCSVFFRELLFPPHFFASSTTPRVILRTAYQKKFPVYAICICIHIYAIVLGRPAVDKFTCINKYVTHPKKLKHRVCVRQCLHCSYVARRCIVRQQHLHHACELVRRDWSCLLLECGWVLIALSLTWGCFLAGCWGRWCLSRSQSLSWGRDEKGNRARLTPSCAW